MKEKQKRIMAINDISCFGKCSLTVALPILSAAGLEACPVPTALLSTHTGEGFKNFTFKNLDDQIIPITEHWKSLDLSFDAIYSGYLGSFEQINYVENIIDKFKGARILIDPVMGDNGRLYTGFDERFAKGLLRLSKKADIIVPNITEASYMLGIEYKDIYSEKDILMIIDLLKKEGIPKAVITGIHMKGNIVSSAVFDGNEVAFIKNEHIKGMYHGTGDVFASVLLACIMKGMSLKDAADIAVWYVYQCIILTKERYGENHYGVDFESILHKLIEKLS